MTNQRDPELDLIDYETGRKAPPARPRQVTTAAEAIAAVRAAARAGDELARRALIALGEPC